jgi:ATP-dependent RNA helicase RhlE
LKTFKELDLIQPIQRALADEKYETPTPIQAKTIPHAILERDVLGCAQTGTGKTAAFALPILNRLGYPHRKAISKSPFVLVLAPTRELAIQIGDSFETYGRHLQLRKALVYGGVGSANQIRMMNRGVHILVATPGRLLDLMNQGHIKLDKLETFVLDESDRMLDMGFLPDLKKIISKLPKKRQSLFFSATMEPKIVKLSQSLLRNPVSINVTPKSTNLEKIKQKLLHVDQKSKQSLLRTILREGDVKRVLVFTKTKRRANVVAEKLERSGIKATAIHGNKSQNARQKALEAFRRKEVQVLVATDVAARGIDIDSITHVVNFDLPNVPENYVHRIGRTGRAGANGVALSFCSHDERSELRAIERLIGQNVPVVKSQLKTDPQEDKQERPHQSRYHAAGKTKKHIKRNAGSKKSARSQSADTTSKEDKPNRRRRRNRKGRNERQRVKLTS